MPTENTKHTKMHSHTALDATPVPGHAEIIDTPREYVQKDPVAPTAHPRITRIDDKTVQYEMPYSLPKGVYAAHPVAGYLVETDDGGWKTLADDHHREKELPRYIKHGDDALRYLSDSHEHFRAGVYAGGEAE